MKKKLKNIGAKEQGSKHGPTLACSNLKSLTGTANEATYTSVEFELPFSKMDQLSRYFFSEIFIPTSHVRRELMSKRDDKSSTLIYQCVKAK